MSANKGALIENLLVHLNDKDTLKQKVALGVLEGIFKQKGQPPPVQILRTLLYCLCGSETEYFAINLLELLIQTWPAFGSHLISENMGLAVLWLYVATRSSEPLTKRADDIIGSIQERNIYVIESDVTGAFVETLKESGRRWTEDGVSELALQILTLTTPKLAPQSQKIIEKECNTVPILVYFLTYLNNPSALGPESVLPAKLVEVTRDNGIPFMIQTFMKHTDPDAKSATLQGIRSFPNLPDFEDPFFDEIIKCITSPNRILQQESLIIANDFIPETYIQFEQYIRALETGGEEAASYMEFLTRKERQAVRFAKNSNCVAVLVKASAAAYATPATEESSFLSLMKNVAVTDQGTKGLIAEGAVPMLKAIVANPLHLFINRAHAVDVLDALGEDLEDLFDTNFVDICRAHWDHWVDILGELAFHHSVKFVQNSSDAGTLLRMIVQKTFKGASAIHVIVNTLTYLFSRPLTSDSKPTAAKQIAIISQHELVPQAIQQLLAQYLDPDKKLGYLRLTCYALLSISNNTVRAHVVEEGNTPLLISLLHNPVVAHSHSEVVVKALALIAFCSCSEFVKHGGVDAFVKLVRQQKHIRYAAMGLWVVATTDAEYHAYMSGVADAFKPVVLGDDYLKRFDLLDYPTQTLLLLQQSARDTKPKSKKKKIKPQIEKQIEASKRPKYQSIPEKLLEYCNHTVTAGAKLNLVKDGNMNDALEICSTMKLTVYFIHTLAIDRFPEIKQVTDFIWIVSCARHTLLLNLFDL